MPHLTHMACTRMVLLVGVLLTSLVGCAEYGYRLNEMQGLNCRPEALKNGSCVAVKGGSK
jgi:hypothetical protein